MNRQGAAFGWSVSLHLLALGAFLALPMGAAERRLPLVIDFSVGEVVPAELTRAALPVPPAPAPRTAPERRVGKAPVSRPGPAPIPGPTIPEAPVPEPPPAMTPTREPLPEKAPVPESALREVPVPESVLRDVPLPEPVATAVQAPELNADAVPVPEPNDDPVPGRGAPRVHVQAPGPKAAPASETGAVSLSGPPVPAAPAAAGTDGGAAGVPGRSRTGESTAGIGASGGGTAGAHQAPAAGLPSPPAAATPAQQQMRYLKAHFTGIRDAVMRRISYPALARRKGWSGTVKVAFTVNESGCVEEVTVAESSGYGLLDKNAAETIRQCAPFPPPPVLAKIVLPITYRLE